MDEKVAILVGCSNETMDSGFVLFIPTLLTKDFDIQNN